MGVLRVGELLSLPVLRGARVIAGHRGLDREVTNVNVMDCLLYTSPSPRD